MFTLRLTRVRGSSPGKRVIHMINAGHQGLSLFGIDVQPGWRTQTIRAQGATSNGGDGAAFKANIGDSAIGQRGLCAVVTGAKGMQRDRLAQQITDRIKNVASVLIGGAVAIIRIPHPVGGHLCGRISHDDLGVDNERSPERTLIQQFL